MADVNQSYNIDTSQAIASLNRLDASINRLNRGISRLDTTSKSVRNLTVSWQTLGRVVATQAIVRGLSETTRLFREAAQAADEFQITFARIQGIADIANLEGVRSQLEAIATSAGRDLNEVTGAALEAFQNDLGTTEETVALLGGAIRDLAVVTESDFQSAVNTISPLIKAYNLDAQQAAEVSSILFQTIDSGVVQLDQLEGRLGGVAKLAADLQIPIEEVFSAIATGTLAGNDTATSMTQLRNVLIKLTKPTQELSAAFQELGVQSFVELQEQGLTLRESLDAIFDALDRDPERFARAFNTIRATLGATNIRLREGADNGSVFDRILGEMSESGGSLAEALQLIEDTDAFQGRENAAQFSVILNDVGEDVIAVKNAFSGLALTVFNDSQKIETALAGGAAAAGLYGASLLGIPLALQAIPPVAVATASALATLWVIDALDNYQTRLGQLRDDLGAIASEDYTLRIIEEQEAARLSQVTRELEEADNAANRLVTRNADALRDFTEGLLDATEGLGDVANRFVESFGDSRSRLLDQIEDQIDSIDSTIASNLRDLTDARNELEDFEFERFTRGLNEQNRFLAIQQRALQEIRDVQEQINQVGVSEDSVEAALAANERAEAFARALRTSAERLGTQQQINQALEVERRVLQNNVEIYERQREALESTNVAELRRGLVEATKLSAEQQVEIERIRDLYSQTNADGTVKSTRQLRDDVIEARRATEELKQSFEDFSDLDILVTTGLRQAAEQAQEALIDGLSQIDVDYSQSIDEFEREFESRTFIANIRFETAALEAAEGFSQVEDAIRRAQGEGLGDRLRTTELIREELNQLILAQEQNASAARIAAQEIEAANARVRQSLIQLREFNIFDGLDGAAAAEQLTRFVEGVSSSFGTLGEEAAGQLRASLFRRLPEIDQLLSEGLIAPSRAEQLETAFLSTIDAIEARIRLLQAEAAGAAPEVAEAARRSLDAIESAGETVVEPQVDDGQVRQLERSVDEVKQSGIEASTSVSSIGPAAGNAVGAVSSLSSTTGSLSSRANAAAQAFRNLERAARAAARAAAEANSSGAGQFAYRGGHIRYRAGGGDVRGQDTIPAMLSPGEFVVNARQARNFFSQLQAINAGAVGQSSGGSTTNITIGDVNVTTPSSVPNDTAREIGQSIKRELRRRTFTL